jgi:putative sigma-54 modulation protein
MIVHYTGKQGVFAPVQQRKIESRFNKLGKLLDRHGGQEKEAHAILTAERHLNHAEVTIRFGDHPLVGVASDVDQFAALAAAVDKLEKQVLKLRTKWRDNKRAPKRGAKAEEEGPESTGPVAAEIAAEEGQVLKVFQVDQHASRKPMTVEEALLAIGEDRDYYIYRDTQSNRLHVLLRRRDGHFNLVEA